MLFYIFCLFKVILRKVRKYNIHGSNRFVMRAT